MKSIKKSFSSGIKHFELNTNTVESPKEQLTKLLFENSDLVRESMSTDLQKFTKQFAAKSGFEITFDVNAKNALIEKAIQQDKSIDAICKELFKACLTISSICYTLFHAEV